MGEYIDDYEFILDLIDDYMDVCDAVESHEKEVVVMKQFCVTFYEDGVRKSRTIEAESIEEAYEKAWSLFDADDLYVSEV